MPILEALGRLCRESDGERLVALLNQHAPTWLVQMPSLLTPAQLETLQRNTQHATRERMLREMGEALDAITAERPLVLALEDLHWSDASTLELLALLARRREPARLLVIGTYRPVDVIVQEHPLRAVKQELQLHGLCEELPLGLLSEQRVAEYLEQRFSVGAHGRMPLHTLAKTIHRRTDGNPLFMVTAVEDLIVQEVISQSDRQWRLRDDLTTIETKVPSTLQHLIERQIERLSLEDQRMLEIASVAGMEFSAAAVAAGAKTETEIVEERCAGLARQERFLRANGTADWPDGTVAARYSFLHALYQEVLYSRLSAGRRQRLHQRIGEREEQAYGERAREIAVELAVHFEQGRDYGKAVQYLQQAGENALRRSAYQEAVTLLTKGLELLKTLSDSSERMQHELTLQLALGDALFAVKGYTAPEVEKAGTRARELCRQVGETPQLFPVLHRLALFYVTRGELQTARELEEQMLRLAQSDQDQSLLSMAQGVLGVTLHWLGELTSARPFLEQAITLYDPQKHPRHTIGTTDPRIDFLSCASWTLWLLGYPHQARKASYEVLTLAGGLSHPFSLAFALGLAASFHILCRERQLAQERAETMITLATEQEFPFWLVWGTSVRGWALTEQGQVEEGIAQLQQGLAAFRGMGTEVGRSHWLALLAEAHGEIGQGEKGLALLAEAFAFVDKTGERWCEAELYRLRGELTLAQSSVQRLGSRVQENQKSKIKRQKAKITAPRPLTPDLQGEAEACFLKAIEIAQRQQAKSWELRATISLARLWQQQGKRHEAHKVLSEIYNWFTEGFDTKDLQGAKTLLEEVSH